MMSATTKPKILFVDDETNILHSLKRLMRGQNADIHISNNPLEAVKLAEEHNFAVVVSDQRMPEMQGSEVLENIRKHSPDTVRILLTGYTDIHAAMDAINKGAIYKFLSKPWNDEALVGIIEEALERHTLVAENERLNELARQQNEALTELNESLDQKVKERTEEVVTLSEKVKKSLFGTIQVMAKITEEHSSLIGSHSKRVVSLCNKLGELLGLSAEDRYDLVIAATLHDIGKVGISPNLLNKSDTLMSAAEREHLMQHTVHGETLIQMIPNMERVAKIIRHHHEQFDGRGYPDGLIRASIPKASRIIAVADAYDNALNRRTGYDTATPKKALEHIQLQSGKAFDPDVVDALVSYINQEGSESGESTELEVNRNDLRGGMVLSRDLVTIRGRMLLKKDSAIDKTQVVQLINFLQTDPPAEGIYIYRHVKGLKR